MGTNIIKYVCKTQKSMLKMAKTKFREIYDALPARAGKAPKTVWIERLAKICMVSEQTVRCWVYGTQKPDALKLSLISKELGVPAEELFS